MFRTRAHHQEAKIALHSLRYHHTYRWPSRVRDGHMCSKHVEAWNKNLFWNKFCAWSWLNTEINKENCVSEISFEVLIPVQWHTRLWLKISWFNIQLVETTLPRTRVKSLKTFHGTTICCFLISLSSQIYERDVVLFVRRFKRNF